MGDDLGRNLRRLGGMAAADRAEDAVMGGCVGKLFGCLLFVLMVILVGAAVGVSLLVKKALPAGSGIADKVLVIGAIGGFFAAIVILGLIQNRLRRVFWRLMSSR
jgi:hypothetical protein